jgi:hypothetical protein
LITEYLPQLTQVALKSLQFPRYLTAHTKSPFTEMQQFSSSIFCIACLVMLVCSAGASRDSTGAITQLRAAFGFLRKQRAFCLCCFSSIRNSL